MSTNCHGNNIDITILALVWRLQIKVENCRSWHVELNIGKKCVCSSRFGHTSCWISTGSWRIKEEHYSNDPISIFAQQIVSLLCTLGSKHFIFIAMSLWDKLIALTNAVRVYRVIKELISDFTHRCSPLYFCEI